MTSIPAAICRISRNNFKLHYLKNKRLYLDHFKKKDEHSSLIISDIIDAERRGYLNV